jgi:uncharacterized protein
MEDDDQRAVIAFLERGESYGRPDAAPRRIDTHISIVFLVGDRVYKLKRAVQFSFVDYRDLAARARFCRAEFELNRRTAPALYLGVCAISRDETGALRWGEEGTVLDWVVEMRRFDESDLFDRMARAGRLDAALMRELADAIAAFHDAAEPAPDFGGAASMRALIDDNHRYLEAGAPPLPRAAVEDLRASSLAALGRVGAQLDRRRDAGQVRRCHGDLHLRNICLFAGAPTLFDCIEFSDEIACIDVLYDIAFLLMDLEHRGLRPLASAVFNRYLDRAPEEDGLAALPLLLSIRAAIRAKVALAAREAGAGTEAGEALAYLDLARALLRPARPRLIAVGGLSGSGKSTLAAALAPDLAPAPGARVIRSDVLRKTLIQVAPETRLPPSAYTAAVNARVYDALRARALATLAAGYSAIVDATFLDAGQRADIAAAAAEAGVPFAGLWLDAPQPVLGNRVDARTGDASDADRAVLTRQLEAESGPIAWPRIDAGGSRAAALAAARAALGPV